MKWISPPYKDLKHVLRLFILNLLEELDRADEFLPAEDAAHLRKYYNEYCLKRPDEKEIDRTVNGFIRGDMKYMLERLAGHTGNPLRVLDAGSGPGTHSLLFGLLGANVLGVDLRPERHALAKKRKVFYERELGLDLKVDFSLENIFKSKEHDCFDLIWVNNAISHIHPLDDFLRLCHRLLRKNGDLVIVDANGLHLVKQVSLYRERGRNLYTTYKDPQTGENVAYAVERILSLPKMSSLLKANGFRVLEHECYIGLHADVSQGVYEKIIRPINRSMLFSSVFGKRYMIVSRKN